MGCCSSDSQAVPDNNTAARQKYDEVDDLDADLDYDSDYEEEGKGIAGLGKEEIIENFYNALKEGDRATVGYYIKKRNDLKLLHEKFENDDSCLHVAVKNQQHRLTLFLLSQGCLPNQPNKDGDTALHIAVRLNDIKIVTLLCQNGADCELANKNGESAANIAANNDNKDIIELLEKETQTFLQTQMSEHKDGGKEHALGKLKRTNTRKVLNDMASIEEEKTKLPKLEGWLEKRQNSIPYALQKRWVIVQDSYFLYHSKQIAIKDARKEKERRKWSNYLYLEEVVSVDVVDNDKEQRRFQMTVKPQKGKSGQTKDRTFIWRAADKKQRDFWVDALNQHIDYQKAVVEYFTKKEEEEKK